MSIEAYAQRLGVRVEDVRERAEHQVELAVERALASGTPRFDLLPPELKELARQRWQEAARSRAVMSGASLTRR